LRLAEEQMNMLWHDYVTCHHQTITPPDVLQDLKKEIAISRVVEQRPALITTGGDEVQISCAVVAVKAIGHSGDVARIARLRCDE
jgi:hypothetical protein